VGNPALCAAFLSSPARRLRHGFANVDRPGIVPTSEHSIHLAETMTPPSSLDSDSRALAARLAVGFSALAVLTTALIVLGAMVRAHGAGLACPDWPLCFGQVIPEFDVRVGFEYSHRVVAGCVSFIFLGLGIAALRSPPIRRVAGSFVYAGAVLLTVQIILGALTVWELLASWTVTSHLVTGNAVNASFVLIAAQLRDASRQVRPAGVSAGLRAAVLVTAAILLGQLILGGLVSSTFAGLACDEWPACHAGEWFPGFEGARGTHLFHRLGAYTLLLAVAGSAYAARGTGRLAKLLGAAAGVTLLQAGVGVANVLLRIPVEVTGLHSFLAACLVMLLALSVREVLTRAEGGSAPATAL
jgi:cytochrome c oxidase assembly protein subunit 15